MIYASGFEFEYVGQPDIAQDKDQHSGEHQIFDLLIGKHALHCIFICHCLHLTNDILKPRTNLPSLQHRVHSLKHPMRERQEGERGPH